jgi:(R,R)-butanediol dehydrogenase/meso-butanediol dehydrogenase/diacetyl reductase
MRAARYYGIEDVRIEDVDEPTPTADTVQIQVSYNGICGTDLHEYFDGPRATPLEPHPLTGVSVPVILGHEAAGIVSGVGAGVEGAKVGDLVVIEPMRTCGVCASCLAGDRNLCDVLAFHGLSTDGGGLAEVTVVPSSMVHRLPAGIDERQAAVIEPLSISHHAIGRSGARPGEPVAIFGGGPIGIGILLGLRAIGVDDVLVVEPVSERRQVAAGFGARVLDPMAHDPAAQVREATAGRGVSIAFETAGAPTTFLAAVSSTAKHGQVVLLTSGRSEVVAPLGQLMASEITLVTSFASNHEFGAVIALMAEGAYPLDGWVEERPLHDLVDAFEDLRRGEAIKLLIDPRQTVEHAS